MARNPFGLPVADDAHRELSMLTGGDRAERIMGNLSDRMSIAENVSGEGGDSKLVSMLDDWMTKEGYDIEEVRAKSLRPATKAETAQLRKEVIQIARSVGVTGKGISVKLINRKTVDIIPPYEGLPTAFFRKMEAHLKKNGWMSWPEGMPWVSPNWPEVRDITSSIGNLMKPGDVTETEDVPWDAEDSLEEARGMGTYGNVTPGVEPYFHKPKSREPRKPGLMGSKHEAALKKGYVDFGLIDVRNAKGMSDYKVAEHIVAAMKNGVSFIRDPDGILANVLRWPVNDLGNKIKWEIAGEYEEQGSYASEGEDWDEEERLGKAAKMANAATVSIKPVKGKTGSGYKVVMKPSQEQIDRKCFPQKRR